MVDCEQEHSRRESSAPRSREHGDSDQFDRAIDRKIESFGRTIRKRALGWLFSTGLGASATAGVMTVSENPPVQVTPAIAPAADTSCDTRHELRLLLDYSAAIVKALREHGVDVDEPRPPALRMDSDG